MSSSSFSWTNEERFRWFSSTHSAWSSRMVIFFRSTVCTICFICISVTETWACGPATEQCKQDDDGVDESLYDSFAHQKSSISGDGVSLPYCATRSLRSLRCFLRKGTYRLKSAKLGALLASAGPVLRGPRMERERHPEPSAGGTGRPRGRRRRGHSGHPGTASAHRPEEPLKRACSGPSTGVPSPVLAPAPGRPPPPDSARSGRPAP